LNKFGLGLFLHQLLFPASQVMPLLSLWCRPFLCEDYHFGRPFSLKGLSIGVQRSDPHIIPKSDACGFKPLSYSDLYRQRTQLPTFHKLYPLISILRLLLWACPYCNANYITGFFINISLTQPMDSPLGRDMLYATLTYL
jgi:hypothetical protein